MKPEDLKRTCAILCRNCKSYASQEKFIIAEYAPKGLPLIRSWLGQCQDCGFTYHSRYLDCPCEGEIKTDEEIICYKCKKSDGVFQIDREKLSEMMTNRKIKELWEVE